MGHIHDAHQAESQRKSAGEQKQQRSVGNPVKRLENKTIHGPSHQQTAPEGAATH